MIMLILYWTIINAKTSRIERAGAHFVSEQGRVSWELGNWYEATRSLGHRSFEPFHSKLGGESCVSVWGQESSLRELVTESRNPESGV